MKPEQRRGAAKLAGHLLNKLISLLSVDDSVIDKTFSLGNRPPFEPRADAKAEAQNQAQAGDEEPKLPRAVPPKIDDALALIKKIFHADRDTGKNADVIIREFTVGLQPPVRAFLVFIEGLADKTTINLSILQPLMLLSEAKEGPGRRPSAEWVRENLLPGNQTEEKDTLEEVIQGILTGTTAVFIDGSAKVLLVETKGFEKRSVADPKTESVVRGPHEGFIENFRTNAALIRRRIRSQNLITEVFKVGTLSRSDTAMMYIEGLTNPKLVEELRRRLASIAADYTADSGIIEQFVEDSPNSIFPQFIATERPDRAAAYITEGSIAVISNSSPFVLIMPATIWGMLHSPEDYYLRWPFGLMIRLIRVAGIMMALFLPAFYLALSNYHPEMIPNDLLLSIAVSREAVPFPGFLEVTIMELAFEIIREAGTRIPSIIGPTIGIVGGLILGQAAVEAKLVSPLLIITTALTALGSFTVSQTNLNFSVRLMRFIYIALAASLGFFGLAIGITFQVAYLTQLKSLGVPILSPVAPFRPPSLDILVRGMVWEQEHRPLFTRPLDLHREVEINRTWHPSTSKHRQPGGKPK